MEEHDDGHHTAIIHRTAGQRFVSPDTCCRFVVIQRSVPGDIVLLDIGLLPSLTDTVSDKSHFYITLNPINNENQTLYLSPFFAALHRAHKPCEPWQNPASQQMIKYCMTLTNFILQTLFFRQTVPVLQPACSMLTASLRNLGVDDTHRVSQIIF